MISVVIPLYNKAHTIVNTLQTVLNQSFNNFEIIIINDGSTDNGTELIMNFSSDSRIRIIDQENQGVSAARNFGVLNAKFDFIAFLDADDEWLPDYLMKMNEAIELFPAAGMYCCAGIVRNADGSEFDRIAQQYQNKILEIDFFENPGVFLHTSATVVAKAQFLNTSGFPVGMKRNQDFALFFSLAFIAPVVYCGVPLSVYVGGVEGQATSVDQLKVIQHVINRFNLVFDNWLKSSSKNKTFVIFTKYELRHLFITNLRDKDYQSIQYFLGGLDPRIIHLFSAIETSLIANQKLRIIAIVFIIITKLRWRLRGYPRASN